MSLPESLERAASALTVHADSVRDANGDPLLLLERLGPGGPAAVLGWLLANEPAEGAELALAWSESEAGAAALRDVEDERLPKAGRKALRRAIHRLRSRGVEVRSDSAPVVARLPDIEDSIDAALVSPLDPRGGRMAYLVAPHPSGGARLFEMVLDDLRGIVDFRVYSAGRSRVRSFLKEVSRRAQTSTLEVAPEALRALIARAAACQSGDRPAPRAFIEHRSQLRLDPQAETPGEAVRAALGPVAAEPEALEAAAELVRKGRIGPWPPAIDRVREVGDEVAEQLDSSVIVSGATRQERRAEVLGAAAGRVFDEAFSAVTATRLRESAYVFWKREGEDEARSCLAAASAFESMAPGENPVARALVETMLAARLAARQEAEPSESEDEESLLVKP